MRQMAQPGTHAAIKYQSTNYQMDLLSPQAMIRRSMQNKIPSHLSNAELVAATTALAAVERRTTVALVAHLAEMEARSLHLEAGYPSMFVYCVQVLRLSEGARTTGSKPRGRPESSRWCSTCSSRAV